MSSQATRVRIFYPADPAGLIPGGIDTFIRGILNWVPEDIQIDLVGATTAPAERPVGRWTHCQLSRKSFNFFPVVAVGDARTRSKIPMAVRFTLALLKHLRELGKDADILEFHRIEPAFAWLWDSRPKNLFLHQNMGVIRNPQADIRWKHAPWIYEAIEKFLLPRFECIRCVRSDAAEGYRQRFPSISDRIHFTPTWMDPGVFSPVSAGQRQLLRQQLAARFELDTGAGWLISVGRLDSQKDPELLVRAYAEFAVARPNTQLLMVGDGVLRGSIRQLVGQLGLDKQVRLLGLQSPGSVADLLRSSELFVLSSAYEGMPMSALEAMGCGTPCVSTNVGEVPRIIVPGVNGEIATQRGPQELAAALLACFDRLAGYSGAPCLEMARSYVPESVLAPVFDSYRRMKDPTATPPAF